MGKNGPASFSITASSNYDEIFMQHSLQFAESLKDLKNLRKQLYTAAEYFESSYEKDDHQQLVIDSSKDYVAKALVNTVDHLGSVADKLNKFFDEKSSEISATNTRFSCIQQIMSTFEGFIDLRGASQHLLVMEAPKRHKQYIFPAVESFQIGKQELIYRNCISCPKYDIEQTKQENPFAKDFQAARVKPHPPLLSKGQPRVPSNESSPNPVMFSFTRVASRKETGHFPLKRSGSVANRSVSLTLSDNKQRSPSEPRGAMLLQTTANRERGIAESYTKRSKHLFKALFNAHRSRH